MPPTDDMISYFFKKINTQNCTNFCAFLGRVIVCLTKITSLLLCKGIFALVLIDFFKKNAIINDINFRGRKPMKIKEILSKNRSSGKNTLSFEVFPPKTSSSVQSVIAAAESIAALSPSFMSVTYGAGGGSSEYTLSVASDLQRVGVTALAHLTCVGASREGISEKLELIKNAGIENILALRGDLPAGYVPGEFKHACELVGAIRASGDFCIGGACYPEGHPESPTLDDDITHLKEKADSGCDFFTTQMFFDNNIFYNFMYKVRDAGITLPVIAGIMPVTKAKQITRICTLSGSPLPVKFRRIVEKFGDSPDAMRQAGIAYATEQIIDLYANGVDAVHVYSMNDADVAKKISDNLSSIIGI